MLKKIIDLQKSHYGLLMLLVILLAMESCVTVQYSEQESLPGIGNRVETEVLQAARQAVNAFNVRDGEKLAALVHPEKGVRFSPSAYVDIQSDMLFTNVQVKQFWTDTNIYTWGFAEGTGEPIRMAPSQYSRVYILSRDFLNPSSINVNSDRASGNTQNIAASVYPGGIRVEYYIEPSIRDNILQNDWAALRLVFERQGNSWFLVAVIHDEWTI
jgi:hypothetical protein